ncbi:MAG TPA: hypothetical protein K8U84_07305 [Paenalcaligenes hominis]|uniref:Glycosyltransferase 2-like domain-containing protein n=1 Tax=Paenalcaligenes hominis TaxID=643674 RepID=A0A9D2VGW8_9BURK|nr:hypothetical protein [Paenalcaligenes hominis]
MASIDFFQTPIFIIVFNRLEALRPVVSWLEQAGYKNIHLIDNASTYPPLLEYLAASPHHVHTMQENHGHLVLWKSGQFDHIIQHQPFVLNDCDVLPSKNCPADVVERLAAILARYKNFTKVGLSLHIDDLPAHYAHKQQVIEWETPFWEHPLEDGTLFEAAIDTTFAYYKPGITPDDPKWWRSIRTAPPLSAHHLPWYVDTTVQTEEDLYYQQHVQAMSSQWSTTDPVMLKEQNIKLMAEVSALRKEIELLKQGQLQRSTYHLRQHLIHWADTLGVGGFLRKIRRKLGR